MRSFVNSFVCVHLQSQGILPVVLPVGRQGRQVATLLLAVSQRLATKRQSTYGMSSGSGNGSTSSRKSFL
jgi:hypothetical protein